MDKDTVLTGYITGCFEFFGRRYDVFDTGAHRWIVKLPKDIYSYRAQLRLTGKRAGERQLVAHKVERVGGVDGVFAGQG